MKQSIVNNINNIFKNFNSHLDDFKGALFIGIFEKIGQPYRFYFSEENKVSYVGSQEHFDYHDFVKAKINTRVLLNTAIKESKISNNLFAFAYSTYEWIVIYDDPETNCSFLINPILSEEEESSDYNIEVFTNDIDVTYKVITPWFENLENKSNIDFGISAVDASNSLYTSWYEYSNHEIDIEKNYNDDLPYDRMCELIEKTDSPELLLFYGEPGTGKTSLIKHFISKYDDKAFVFIDGTLLANVSQEKLMSYFLENQNTIFILEDCEKVLMNREHYVNPVMPILLNLTDGIIGDVLGIKLICTFNTSLNNIDKALIRKGRLSLKYEFKKLSKDKVEKITGKSADKEMTLADIYYEEENDYSKKQQNRIGF